MRTFRLVPSAVTLSFFIFRCSETGKPPNRTFFSYNTYRTEALSTRGVAIYFFSNLICQQDKRPHVVYQNKKSMARVVRTRRLLESSIKNGFVSMANRTSIFLTIPTHQATLLHLQPYDNIALHPKPTFSLLYPSLNNTIILSHPHPHPHVHPHGHSSLLRR